MVRSLFESAAASYELHYIVVDPGLCKQRIAERNCTKPEGIYWGHVSEELFDAVDVYFQSPASEEGFVIVEHSARHDWVNGCYRENEQFVGVASHGRECLQLQQ